MAEPLLVKFEPSETQEKFIRSTVLENCFVGPRGEGKSDGGIMAMTYHASIQDKKYRPIPWAIVRDTWKNIERTTYRSFMYPTNPKSLAYQLRGRIRERDGGRQLKLVDKKGDPIWIAFLFGMDTPDDLNQLLSMQLGGLWVEEAAPAVQEDIGKGIPEEVWTLGITSLRHTIMSDKAFEFIQETRCDENLKRLGVKEIREGILLGALVKTPYGDIVVKNRRAQITMNYPSEDHWTWVRFYDEPALDRALFRIPKGENVHIDDQYRENMAKSLAGRPDLLDRLVIGRPAHVQIGEAVTPEYNELLHRTKEPLSPMSQLTTFRFWDGGLNPTCVFSQLTSRGKFVVTDTLRGSNIGMKQFIHTYVKPMIADRYYEIGKWRDIGDPSLRERDQSDSTVRASDIIEKELDARFEPGISSWQSRIEAMRELLTRLVDGEAMFVVSKHEKILHRALSGGWHYQKDSTGKVLRDKPVKDIHCVDTKTECLTQNGWKYYNDLKIGESVYGYDFDKGVLIQDNIKDINYYEGKHSVLSFNNLQNDIVVTPNHRCVCSRRTRSHNGVENFYPPDFIYAKDIHTGHRFLRTASLSPLIRTAKNKEYSNEFIKLCAWVMTEGNYRGTGQIWISQSMNANPEYCEQIKDIIKYFPNTYFRIEKNNGVLRLNAILKWEIAYLIRILMPNKYPSTEFISQMTLSQMRLFLFEAIKGDGDNPVVFPPLNCIGRLRDFWHQDITPRIACGKKDEANSIQHMATLIGIRSILHDNKNRGYSHVSLTKLGRYSPLSASPIVDEVDGVWCPETETHTWVARRNGQVFITGNSHPSDALSHGIAKIFRYQNENKVKLPASKKRIAISSAVKPLLRSSR